jgi:hypothetical protein
VLAVLRVDLLDAALRAAIRRRQFVNPATAQQLAYNNIAIAAGNF